MPIKRARMIWLVSQIAASIRAQFWPSARPLVALLLLSSLGMAFSGFRSSTALAGAVSATTIVLGSRNQPSPSSSPGFAANPLFAPGYFLYLSAEINDASGLADLPSSITFTQGATTYIVPFNSLTGSTSKEYDLLVPYSGQSGVYTVNVPTVANGTVAFTTHQLDNTIQLPFATGITFSDDSTTPTFSFNAVTGANGYGYEIRSSNGTTITLVGCCQPSPSFPIPLGLGY